MATIFTKIIRGEIPCHKIYEDEHCFAFLDIHPIQEGHTLIVPKIEVDHFVDVPEPYYTAVFLAAQKIGKALQKATGCARVGTKILGWDVPHFHYHVIPMWGMGDLSAKTKSPSAEKMKAMQDKILANLKQN